MAFPHDLLSVNAWRHVGLGLTTTVFGLGALAIFAPETAGKSLGQIPTTPEGRAMNQNSMVFLGIRDVSVALVLFWLHNEGKQKEMGVIFSAWTLVCVVDTWIATKGLRTRDGGMWSLCVGGVVTALAGAGLVQS